MATMKTGIDEDSLLPEGEYPCTIVSTSHVVGQFGPQTKITMRLTMPDGTNVTKTKWIGLPQSGPINIKHPVAQLTAAALFKSTTLDRDVEIDDEAEALLGKKVIVVINHYVRGEKSKKAGEKDWSIAGFKPYIVLISSEKAVRIRSEFAALYPDLTGDALALQAQTDVIAAVGSAKKVAALTEDEAEKLETYLKALKAVKTRQAAPSPAEATAPVEAL